MFIIKKIKIQELVGMNYNEVTSYLDDYEVKHYNASGDYLMYVPNFKTCVFVLAFDGDKDLCVGEHMNKRCLAFWRNIIYSFIRHIHNPY